MKLLVVALLTVMALSTCGDGALALQQNKNVPSATAPNPVRDVLRADNRKRFLRGGTVTDRVEEEERMFSSSSFVFGLKNSQNSEALPKPKPAPNKIDEAVANPRRPTLQKLASFHERSDSKPVNKMDETVMKPDSKPVSSKIDETMAKPDPPRRSTLQRSPSTNNGRPNSVPVPNKKESPGGKSSVEPEPEKIRRTKSSPALTENKYEDLSKLKEEVTNIKRRYKIDKEFKKVRGVIPRAYYEKNSLRDVPRSDYKWGVYERLKIQDRKEKPSSYIAEDRKEYLELRRKRLEQLRERQNRLAKIEMAKRKKKTGDDGWDTLLGAGA